MKPRYRFVFFDVDSTLVTIEGIDELAAGNEEIACLTNAAMNGELPLDEVYARRLDIIRPSRSQVEELGVRYTRSLVDGAHDLVSQLLAAGCDVHLVTAGLAQAIYPLAEHLAIPRRAVHAVALLFDESGNYVDYDRRSLLARPGGKELVVHSILARSKGKSVFIGDGVSDLETKPVVDLFIGFGGVQQRQRVREGADVYVDAPTFRAVLPHLMTTDEE